jgi:light-regulated signal transduction histidine kinase (bacteriophytochrome)
MGQLIDDLLALSKVTRAEMKHERVDLTEIAAQIVAELKRLGPGRAVDVTIAPGLTAAGDPQLVRLAMQNLIDNAWKFTGRCVQAAIDIGATKDEDGASVLRARQRRRIRPELRHQAVRGVPALHPLSEFPCTGIGLATVKRIVHRHGGHVWAQGRIDGGACFYFTLS